MQAGQLHIDSPLGRFNTAELLPKPVHGSIPLIVTGSSGQSPEWIAEHADGWLTYPEATHTPLGPQKAGCQNSGLACPDSRWRFSPTHDQRVAGLGG